MGFMYSVLFYKLMKCMIFRDRSFYILVFLIFCLNVSCRWLFFFGNVLCCVVGIKVSFFLIFFFDKCSGDIGFFKKYKIRVFLYFGICNV